MRAFEDGWVDERSRQRMTGPIDKARTADEVRREVDAFRGRVISLTYNLERLVDSLIVWHLFRDRDDGMAAIFEEDIMHGGTMGLERKVRLARTIATEWLYEDDDDPGGFGRAISSSKSYRDQVAHWPTRLQPLESDEGRVVDYVAFIERGKEVARGIWTAGISGLPI